MTHPIDRLVRYTLGGGLPQLILIAGLLAGVLALVYTPREEEPQIVVPMVDVTVEAPGLSARQVERQVTIPLEKLLAQIPGVEHVYSTTAMERATVTLSFFVGEDREDSILNSYNKLYSNQHRIPPVVGRWMMRPVEVDDVPVVMLGLWSENPERYSDYELRRMADEISTFLQGIPSTSEVNVVGGRPRTAQILLDPESMGARKTTAEDIVNALAVTNILRNAGNWTFDNRSIQLEAGDVLRNIDELDTLVVNVINGVPVYLSEVAQVVDGPAGPPSYTWIGFSRNHPAGDIGTRPMVAISVAKQRGSNAVAVAANVHRAMASLRQSLLPRKCTWKCSGTTARPPMKK